MDPKIELSFLDLTLIIGMVEEGMCSERYATPCTVYKLLY